MTRDKSNLTQDEDILIIKRDLAQKFKVGLTFKKVKVIHSIKRKKRKLYVYVCVYIPIADTNIHIAKGDEKALVKSQHLFKIKIFSQL